MGTCHEQAPLTPVAAADRWTVACGELSLGRADLPVRQSVVEEAPDAEACEAALARTLGHDTGTELYLVAPEPDHQTARPEHDLCDRAGSWRARNRGEHVPGGDEQRALSPRQRGRGGD